MCWTRDKKRPFVHFGYHTQNRIDAILDSEDVRAEYGLGAGSSKPLYRTVERLGRNSDSIVRYLGEQLTSRYGVTLGRVLIDWAPMYFEAPDRGLVVRFLYSGLRTMTAETIIPEVTSFSLTVHRHRNGLKSRIFINFGTVISVLHGWKLPFPVPKGTRTDIDRRVPITRFR